MSDLLEQLARLTDEQRLDVFRAAKGERRRRVLSGLRVIRKTVLADIISHRKAARFIDEVVTGRHDQLTPAQRATIRLELETQVGSFEDIPGPETLRKLFDE